MPTRTIAVSMLAVCPLAAGDVIDHSLASDLAGSDICVTFGVEVPGGFNVFSECVTLEAGSDESVFGEASGVFDLGQGDEWNWSYFFGLDGDTSENPWTLTNTSPDPDVYILSVLFFAGPQIVFDSGSEPSTPGSGPGIPFAETISGPPVYNTGFDLPWEDPSNTGDLWTFALVQWSELTDITPFAPGVTAQFIIDSDLVPAGPTTVPVLIGLGFMRRRRR